MKSGPALIVILGSNAAIMATNDGLTDRKAETKALLLGGEEGFE